MTEWLSHRHTSRFRLLYVLKAGAAWTNKHHSFHCPWKLGNSCRKVPTAGTPWTTGAQIMTLSWGTCRVFWWSQRKLPILPPGLQGLPWAPSFHLTSLIHSSDELLRSILLATFKYIILLNTVTMLCAFILKKIGLIYNLNPSSGSMLRRNLGVSQTLLEKSIFPSI